MRSARSLVAIIAMVIGTGAMSRAAADALGFLKAGRTRVRLEVVQ